MIFQIFLIHSNRIFLFFDFLLNLFDMFCCLPRGRLLAENAAK